MWNSLVVMLRNTSRQNSILRCITKLSKEVVDQVEYNQRLIDKSSTPLIPRKGVLRHVLRFGV
jgi:hypothetical protein